VSACDMTFFFAAAAAGIIMANVFHRVTGDFSAISRSVCCVPKATASFFCLRSFSFLVRTPTIFVSYEACPESKDTSRVGR
jgi:hypothetical protein